MLDTNTTPQTGTETVIENTRSDSRPVWMREEGAYTLQTSYTLPGETIVGLYTRVAQAAGARTTKATGRATTHWRGAEVSWAQAYFDAMWSGWLCPASPVLSNLGTTRGLPISCNSIHVGDSVHGIFSKSHEAAMLAKNGAGLGVYVGDIRGRGKGITNNGASKGVVPWLKVYEATIGSVSQGSTRRGSAAFYLPIEHLDAEEFLDIRRPTGDPSLRTPHMHHGVTIGDAWMEDMLAGDPKKRALWLHTLRTRIETGEPYLMFRDSVNSRNPIGYKNAGLDVKTSNLCSEVVLYTDENHTFVCCLASLNLFLFDEWKDTTLPALTVRFLDAVLDEYIEKAANVPGLEASVRSAVAGRALGIGVLGWHSLLQSRQVAFDSSEAMRLNRQVFSVIRKGAETESHAMALEFGEPAWCQGQGMRHSHLMAVAPTTSNSLIAGGYSQGIEPLAGPEYAQAVAQGTLFRANVVLEQHIERTKADVLGTWQAIRENGNSLAGLDSIFSREEQVVFASSFEANQGAIVRQAAQRQTWVDQAQSVNLFIRPGAPANKINELHLLAWRLGLKTLYYVRSKAVLQADKLRRVSGTEATAPASDPLGPCLACEG